MNNKYLIDAKRFYDEAVKEFKRGQEEENEIIIRDAAEKGWNAMVQATNHLLQKFNLPIPDTHREMRRLLAELESQDYNVASFGFRDRLMARFQTLHADCFYDGLCPLEALEKDIVEKVKGYIEDVASL